MGRAGWKDSQDVAPPEKTPFLAEIGCAHPAYAVCISGRCYICMGAGRWNQVTIKNWRELPPPPAMEIFDIDI